MGTPSLYSSEEKPEANVSVKARERTPRYRRDISHTDGR
jgi:hypothetical protein